MASVLIFIVFLQINKIPALLAKVVTFVSPLTFGVYLIHNNRNFSHFLCEEILRIDYWLVEKSNLFVVTGLLLLVFIVCAMIEWLRQQLFKLMRVDVVVGKMANACRCIGDRLVPPEEEE